MAYWTEWVVCGETLFTGRVQRYLRFTCNRRAGHEGDHSLFTEEEYERERMLE